MALAEPANVELGMKYKGQCALPLSRVGCVSFVNLPVQGIFV